MNDNTHTASFRRKNIGEPSSAQSVRGIFALPGAMPDAAAIAALVGTADLKACFATGTGRTLLAELRRRVRRRHPRPVAPALNGTPVAATDFAADRHGLESKLRLGAMLADCPAALDNGNIYNISPTGAKRITGRAPGAKGWLAQNRVKTSYSTLMRYKRLVLGLREFLHLDGRIPFEWLLPGTAPVPDVPGELRSHYAAARRRLAKLLREYPNVYRLGQHLDEALGILRLPVSRKALAAPLGDPMLESARRELLDFLQSTDLTARQEKIRRAALEWLAAH